jgi:8-oxo-dGTP pyrophosphatase MutT (NUDIX family)
MSTENTPSGIERERQPGDSVRIAIFNRENPAEFLVVAEADDPTNYKLPGGKFDPTDTDETTCATRELSEELGLTPEEVRLQPAKELVNDDGTSARFIFSGVMDPADLVLPEADEDDDDAVIDAKWVTEAPEGKNQGHITSAVAAAREAVSTQ